MLESEYITLDLPDLNQKLKFFMLFMKMVSINFIKTIEYWFCDLEKEPILATDAVKVINDNVNQDEVALLLGHPLKIQAERMNNEILWI